MSINVSRRYSRGGTWSTDGWKVFDLEIMRTTGDENDDIYRRLKKSGVFVVTHHHRSRIPPSHKGLEGICV